MIIKTFCLRRAQLAAHGRRQYRATKLGLLALPFLLQLSSTPTLAQNASLEAAASSNTKASATSKRRSREIEEVIVSAQKRDEAVQDVPISMSVMDANFMVEQGVTDLREALLYVPNVAVEQAGFFAAPRARGFTFNNNNKAFEPPLGLAIDGIPYTRIPYFLAATFDLKRIEVLRGPQGTTFGKNTTAGLIHMLTADPTEEFAFSANAQTGELNRQRVELMASGPVIKDFMNIRVAAFDDKRDGFVENTTDDTNPKSQEEFRGHDRHGVRLKFAFPDLLGSSLKFSIEKVKLSDLGTGFEIIRATDEVKEFLEPYDPNADYEQGNYKASLDDPDGRTVDLTTFNIEWNYDIGEWGLVAVAGHSVLDQDLELDTDFTPAPAIFGIGKDRSPTITGEFRVVSPPIKGLFGLDWFSGDSDFVAGVFYQDRRINDSEFRFIFDMPSYLGLISASGSDEGDEFLGLLPPLGEDQFVEDATQTFEQQATTIALFGEFKWNFAEQWTLQVGGRQGQEKKSAQWHQFYNQTQEAVVLPAAGLEEFEAERDHDENQFQYKISLNWQPADNISLFAHYAEAVKGGGFNAFAFRNVDDELEYFAEYTTEYSLNAKTNWLDNTLQVNASLFYMFVEDFQVLSRDPERTAIGIGVTLVKNAAEAVSQGLEADVQWRPLDWLTVIGTVGYLDTEYLKFENNECPPDRTEDGGCDASGKSFPFAPEWNNTLTLIVNQPLWDTGLELTASTTVEQFTKQYLDTDLDERKVQGGFERFKASLGINNPEQGWSAKIVGENLTNENSGIRQGDLFSGVFVEIAEQPRTVYAQFRYDF